MTNIAITQRLLSLYDGQEIREALDIRWYDFIKACGFSLIPISIKQNLPQFLKKMEISGIILSGGNDLFSVNPEKVNDMRDTFEKKLLAEAIKTNIPVIGVCRGMQLINEYFSGSIYPVKNHVATTHEIKNDNVSRLVNSFHNYAVKTPHNDLIVDFVSADGVIEAFHHKDKNISAIMWHPEREKTFKNEDIELFKKIFSKG